MSSKLGQSRLAAQCRQGLEKRIEAAIHAYTHTHTSSFPAPSHRTAWAKAYPTSTGCMFAIVWFGQVHVYYVSLTVLLFVH
eukprot:6465508-Amphidinium_carterae.1